jgi:anti-anti-sigma regulatory factor
MKPSIVEVYASSPIGLRAQVAAAVDHALELGATVVVFGLDSLPEIDDSALSAIIIALRRLREVGGSIRLVTQSAAHRERLAVTGLDRVFAVFPSADDAGGRDEQGDRPFFPLHFAAAITRVVLATLLLSTLLLAPVSAQEDATAAIDDAAARLTVSRLVTRDPNLQSFEADVQVDIAMRTFPWVHPKLVGKTYFKRPDRYEIVFARVPWYAKGLDHLYADIGDPSTWSENFVITADGERNVGGRRQLALHMVQRVRGMIQHEEAYIDPVAWTINELDYFYYNGGSIEIQQTFSLVDGFTLLHSQHATIAIPHIRVVANSTFDAFRTNVAIDDSVFIKNAQAQQ